MAGYIKGISATFISAADYSATPYRIVHVTGEDIVTRSTDADGAGQWPLGVLTDEVGAASGDAVTVQLSGIAKIEAGAAAAVGSSITTDGSGRGILTTTAGDFCIGISLQAAGAAGDIIPVALTSFVFA
tara:strand:- start:122 stop:508 length:387 start_codon:yes stop_codon:yes gene_type:complete